MIMLKLDQIGSLRRWLRLGVLVMLAASLGCVADATGTDQAVPAVKPLAGELLASVRLDSHEQVVFVEIEPEVVVATGVWNADEESALGALLRELPRDATLVQTYEHLAGAEVSTETRERLAEVERRLQARIERARAAEPAAVEQADDGDPARDALIEKSDSEDAAWFIGNWCGNTTDPRLHHNMCATNVSHCGYRSYAERYDATNHHMYLFNQSFPGAPLLDGRLEYRTCATCSWKVTQFIQVAPRTVNWTSVWSPNMRRRSSVGFNCTLKYSISEYWWSRS
jgi:hypothetical protein